MNDLAFVHRFLDARAGRLRAARGAAIHKRANIINGLPDFVPTAGLPYCLAYRRD